MANITAPRGFKSGVSTGALIGLNYDSVVQIQNSLRNLGYYAGPVNGVADFATVGAIGQFQYTFGFGVQNNWSHEMTYALLTANHYVVNGLPAPFEFYESLRLGAQVTGLPLKVPKLDEPAPAPVQLPAPDAPGPGAGAPPSSTPAPAVPPGVTGPTRESATAILRSTLAAWGFSTDQTTQLADWAWGLIKSGASQAEITDGLYQHPIFNAAFPEYAARRTQGLPVSVEDILNYRQGFSDVVNYFGLNQVYDTATTRALTTSLITGNVSLSEATDRIVRGFNEIRGATPEAQEIFAEWYGPASQAALASYFLAPEQALPNLERQVQMAELAGAGARFGFGVGQGLAETLARQGTTEQQALSGFQQIDYLQPLFQETVGEGEDLTAMGEGVGAVFGTEAGAQATLERRRASRSASVSGGGGVAASGRGIIGLGTAS